MSRLLCFFGIHAWVMGHLWRKCRRCRQLQRRMYAYSSEYGASWWEDVEK